MEALQKLVCFRLDERRYAVSLDAVETVVRSVELTALPKAPEIVLGVVNVRGRVVPVIDVRRRFRLPAREISLSDHLMIARTSKRPVALLVDSVEGVSDLQGKEYIPAQSVVPGIEYVKGIINLEDGMVFIHDLGTFLSLEEEGALEDSLNANG